MPRRRPGRASSGGVARSLEQALRIASNRGVEPTPSLLTEPLEHTAPEVASSELVVGFRYAFPPANASPILAIASRLPRALGPGRLVRRAAGASLLQKPLRLPLA